MLIHMQVWLSNLPTGITDEDVKSEMRVCGPIKQVELVHDRKTGVYA